MGDGGYMFDEELSPEFLEFEKYDFFRTLGSNQYAFDLTVRVFKIDKETLMNIISKNGGKIIEREISEVWNGYCPESWLKGKQVKMRLNKNDFYESEETGLQIAVLPGVQAVILNFRGIGDFRSTVSYADEIENGELLSPQNTDKPPFNRPTEVFQDSKQIINYLSSIKQYSKMIIQQAIDNKDVVSLAAKKLKIDKEITDILKQENPDFSYKKLVADLGEYHAKRNIISFFEVLKYSPNRVSECDLIGVLKTEYSKKWKLPKEVKVEVKTRYWQKGSPHLGNIHKDNFQLLVFVSLNEDYSIHYISMVKGIDLKVTTKNKVIYNEKIEPLFATEEKFIEHK